jgi:hypothetical protein
MKVINELLLRFKIVGILDYGPDFPFLSNHNLVEQDRIKVPSRFSETEKR